MTKIKICGITNKIIVSGVGIDAIGLVFYKKSRRFIDMDTANTIVDSLPPFINRVGLFVNENSSFIDSVITKVALDTLQFHGNETARECAQYSMPFIKAVRVKNDTNLYEYADNFYKSCGLLLDSYSDDCYGGSGKTFDWNLANVKLDMPVILAGGLNTENVTKAIKIAHPYAVDVSSGVEIDGVKDITKITNFVNRVKK